MKLFHITIASMAILAFAGCETTDIAEEPNLTLQAQPDNVGAGNNKMQATETEETCETENPDDLCETGGGAGGPVTGQ